ncbi:beta-1,3-galactosyl-O-glycosyl-glycoprotein beta-1,6-N-acetylglucosaminyltransferase-like [Saccostrea echinata]|uniref:beta-1,3-galactosyl-O-glycosyl-glycoprotein beta-1,6-N-acetylglucosaminyltransferase-like n=1 Tax=Saccostrea echinata TaxID=191078 RepID=UPI002A7F054F|nr:beta-1,3-galactosyl-O-glycosyl-glycoprotein beta-1,6-N-acetylglucosaminyltransferase-like [Saccostrea echinata]
MERYPFSLRYFVSGMLVAFFLTFYLYQKIFQKLKTFPMETKEKNFLIDDGPPPNRFSSYSNNDMSKCRNLKRKNITCGPLIRGEENAVTLSKTTRFSDPVLPCMILNLVKNCTALLDLHGYIVQSLSQEELNFPLAFTIKMHTNADQGEQLLRNIYRSHNVYCIYVDRKAIKQFFNIMQQLGRCFQNVFVVEGRQRVTYASIDLVHAELECMRVLMKSNVKWKYYINLTGQEFPLKTNLEIVQILKTLNGANDIESYDFPVGLQYRYKYKYVKVRNKMIQSNTTHPSFRYPIKIRKGSAYAMLTYAFVNFVLFDDISEEFIEWLSYTYSPEETLFATLNSLPWAPGGYDIMTSEESNTFLSRAIKWQMRRADCGGQWVRSVCVYGPSDLPWLLRQPQVIANKFDIRVDTTSVDCLEEIIRQRTYHPNTGDMNWSYYKNLPHVKLYKNLTQRIGTRQYSEYLLRKKSEWKNKHGHVL